MHDGNMFLFLPMQLVFLGPFVTPLWIAGLVWLGCDRARREARFLAVAWGVLTVTFIATAGKPYYLAGLYPSLVAAGAVWLERRSSRWVRRAVAVVATASVLALPLAVPILPAGATGGGPIAGINPELRETYGWETFARAVDAVPGAAVFTQSYGEAGALQQFSPTRPVYSGHNNYWLWGPPPDDAKPVVVVGHFSTAYVVAHFAGCELRATIDNPAHVPNKERGAHVWRCTGPVHQWRDEWPSLRHYNA